MTKINCILLVDDNQADNYYHTIKIKEAGVCNHVKTVTDGAKALDYLIKSGQSNKSDEFPKPNIIFLDINMPGMNGFDFLEEYQKLEDNLKSDILIIMLTTSLNPDDKEKAEKIEDISEYQNKPLTVAGIQETVNKYFKTKETEQSILA